MKPQSYLGLMSGTSLDGVDAVRLEIKEANLRITDHLSLPFDDAIRKLLYELCHGKRIDKDQLGEASFALAHYYAKAANSLGADSVEAIGCHGQTIWHAPQKKAPFTWQLFNPALVAHLTGVPVVSDFRSKDLALGGQGAPLMPAFHRQLLKNQSGFGAMVNIGGIANITLPFYPQHGFSGLGYDTGPGNVLLDEWIGHCCKRRFDEDGAWAKEHRVDEGLLAQFLQDPFFLKKAPKSTGREYFNWSWIDQFKACHKLPQGVVQSTLMQLVVEVVAGELAKSPVAVEHVYVAGGGAHNKELMRRLCLRLESLGVARARSIAEIGIEPQQLEGAGFAWFAHLRMRHEKLDTTWFTGATSAHYAGSVTLP